MDHVHHWPTQFRELPVSIQSFVILALCVFIYAFAKTQRPYAGFPIVSIDQGGLRRPWQPAYTPWITDAKSILAKGTEEHPGCFQVLTASGYKIVVPNRFADELKSNPHLSFNEALAPDLMANYPGFEGHRESLKSATFIQDLTRIKLTQNLALLTDVLVEESRDAIHDTFGENRQWQTRPLKDDLMDLVSRLSSRVFLGRDLCRNKALMRLFKEHTADISVAMNQLQKCPPLIRPIVYWFIPSCARLRRQVHEISAQILPEVEKRRHSVELAMRNGGKQPKSVDSIAWMVELSNGRSIDYVAAQLALSFAAVHMTADALCKCFMQICDTPGIAPKLRKEMLQVLQEYKWGRTTLFKFDLMDSFLKEVQRTNPMSYSKYSSQIPLTNRAETLLPVNMIRMVKKDTRLSDGTTLPAGCRILILDDKLNDPDVFPHPGTFDAERFLRMRQQPGEEHRHQFVSVTSNQLGFGLGTHACPGRFFAANEIKIAMCFMLLKYDFRHVPGWQAPNMLDFDMFRMCNPGFQVQMRRRTESRDDKAL